MKGKNPDLPLPLQASIALLSFLEAKTPELNLLSELARYVDGFVTSSYLLEDPSVSSIENAGVGYDHADDQVVRQMISDRFPNLGFYWKAIDPIIRSNEEPELGTGDAIDDLLDIFCELKEVVWLLKHHGKNEALAGLKFRYEHHLYMHVFPLRVYLEEMIRHG